MFLHRRGLLARDGLYGPPSPGAPARALAVVRGAAVVTADVLQGRTCARHSVLQVTDPFAAAPTGRRHG